MTEILAALHGVSLDPNPIAIGVATFVATISGIGLLLRQGRQNLRNDSLDKAQDKYVAALAADLVTAKNDIKAIREELDRIAGERNALYRLQADTAAKLQTVQSEMAALKVEHDRLRLQYDAQGVELRNCRAESHAANRKIAALEAQVRELQAINAAHSNVARAETAAERQEHAAEKQDQAADKMQNAVERFKGDL